MSFEREKRPADCAVFEAMFEQVMKANNLSASDKDIARWVDAEMKWLVNDGTPGTAATNLA